MEAETKNSFSFREIITLISTIISWTIFVLLLICAAFLLYYFVATRIYAAKGSGYEPKYSLYTIVSPSMVPNINVYDVIVDVKVDKPEDIKINDVITFNSSIPEVHGATITHRVIAISKDSEGNYYYQTKGDNNLIEDGVSVPFKSVVGKVTLKIPQLGKVQKIMATKTGWMIAVLIPALYIIVKDIFKIIKLSTDDVENRSKFIKLLNKPLLTTKKPKLLGYTEQHAEEQKQETTNVLNQYYEEDDIDIDDLPNLK